MTTRHVVRLTLAAVAACALTIAACGGGGGTSPSPSPAPAPAPTPAPAPSPTPAPTPSPAPAPAPSPSPAPAGATITITSSGVSPKTVTITQGSRVTFINNDRLSHDMESDPHPEHTDCPDINQVGFIVPGQTKLTGNMNVIRTCGFHDHQEPDVTSLQGSIIIVGQ